MNSFIINTELDNAEKPIAQITMDWEMPVPFVMTMQDESAYPLPALPAILQKTVSDYQHYGQQPISLIACGALANVSLACQSLANVARDSYLVSPVSLYFIVLASSGERKSASDNLFSQAARSWEERARYQRLPMVNAAKMLHRAWKMQCEELTYRLRSGSFSDDDEDTREELEELMMHEPEIPLLPMLYFEDVTQEALAHSLAHGWPSASLWSDEAGIIIGSQSMQSNPTRFVALLNRLWDAKLFTTHRKTSDNFVLKNRRLTLNLLSQPILMQQLLGQSQHIARQSGFLPRCLLAYPKSLMGTRLYQEPNDSLSCFSAYHERITACLSQSEELGIKGCINLPTLVFSPQAKQKWIQFFNHMESGLADNGPWAALRDFVSKAAENSARLAALFHLFEGKVGDISTEHIESAIEIIRWHMQETRRLLATESSQSEVQDAQRLLNWLMMKDHYTISAREIQRLSPLRDKSRINKAIDILMDHHVIRETTQGNRTVLEMNPHCSQ
jgi:hypothetical protein